MGVSAGLSLLSNTPHRWVWVSVQRRI